MLKPLSKNRIKFYQKLNQKKFRDKENLYIISGLRGVQSALENDAGCAFEIIIEDGKENLLEKIGINQHKNATTVSAKDFKLLNDEINPQGICLIAKKTATAFNVDLIQPGQIIFLDRISDPGNLGTILRSAAWFGIKTILLSANSADPFQPKVVRSSAGAINSVSIFENVTSLEISQIKSQKDYKIFGTDVVNGRSLAATTFSEKTLFLFGSEAHGLDNEYKNLCDENTLIPKTGTGESLNLANAASIVMYQASLNK
ncbi:MAG: RNA methyltransferase [Calditrichaeota bacterium]|nr:MAG: RNA methyltransferase [Calditrichota bacterium]MBL1206301.1 RNA methyltransferase [Calditrichota bacterium]NOG46127.1 RNA methyltransferase [Calditrichota bacterium]